MKKYVRISALVPDAVALPFSGPAFDALAARVADAIVSLTDAKGGSCVAERRVARCIARGLRRTDRQVSTWRGER